MVWYSPSIKYFKIFGSKCYIKRNDDVGKFDPRSDEGMFLGYSLKFKAFNCFNYRTKTIVECAHVRIDENFGTKEKIMEYNSNEEPEMTNRGNLLLLKANNDLQNSTQTEIVRDEQSTVLEIRIKAARPSPNKNLVRNNSID